MNNKVVLAYSGGLDTTYCAVYLKKVKGLEIHALTVNTGGFSADEIEQIAARAKSLGVASFECVDVTKEYYDSCIKYLIFGNVLKNATYPLSVSAERMVQAIAVAEHVKKTGATAVAHGSTVEAAGNDQVRFDMVFQEHGYRGRRRNHHSHPRSPAQPRRRDRLFEGQRGRNEC